MDATSEIALDQRYLTFEFDRIDLPSLVETEVRKLCQACRAHHNFRLIVQVPNRPSRAFNSLEIFHLVEKLIHEWDRRIRVAVVIGYQYGPLEEFGLLIAHNRGVNISIYESEAEALAWLTA